MRPKLFADEDLLGELRQQATQLNRPIQHKDMNGSPHGNTIIRRFGGWNRALLFAGLEVTNHYRVESNIRKLSNIERAYVACAIDTDGCIISRYKYVVVTNTDLPFLEHIQKICGGGIIRRRKFRPKQWKVGYELRFRWKEVDALLPQIVKFLFIKKNKAEGILKGVN